MLRYHRSRSRVIGGHVAPVYAITNTNGDTQLSKLDDAVADFTENALANGQDLIAYYKNMGDIETAHSYPEWECKTPEGDTTSTTFTMMEFSSPWRDVVYQQLLELAEKGVKGIYFDFVHMPHWGCYGTNMESLFEQQTGLESPHTNSAGHHWSNHPHWPAYMEFQNKVIADAFQYWNSGVSTQYPEFTLSLIHI